MKKTILFILLLAASSLEAQLLQTAADTQAVINLIPFPQASATMIVSFNAAMLDLYTLPKQEAETRPSLEELMKRYEKDKQNITLLMDIYYAHFDKNDPQSGMPYLQKAYNIAVDLYEMNPSNIELLEQMTEMLVIVNRMPDVPVLWEGYTQRNPEVAKGWAKLALYQIQILDTINCRNSLNKAYALGAEQPEIYVTALLEVVYKMLLQMQGQEEKPNIKADLAFFEKALAQNKDSDPARIGYNTAKLLELFYSVMLSNVDRFGEDKSFKMTMDERQKTEWTELEKSFKEQLQNPKIVNKFMMLKSLLVLEVLRGEPDMGLAYLEESKKYIKNDVDLYKMLSFGYIPLRKYQKAIPHLKKATELRPNFDDIFALARLQFENHEYEASLATLESLLQSFPDKLDIVFGIVSIQMREGKFKDACSTLFRLQDLYKDEIDMENKDPYFPFYKAICTLVFSKNKDEVKKALQGVIDQDLPWADEAKELMKRFF